MLAIFEGFLACETQAGCRPSSDKGQKAPKRAAQRRQVFGSPCLMQAEIVITYIDHPWGGAAKFAALAEHQGKTVIPLGTV